MQAPATSSPLTSARKRPPRVPRQPASDGFDEIPLSDSGLNDEYGDEEVSKSVEAAYAEHAVAVGATVARWEPAHMNKLFAKG